MARRLIDGEPFKISSNDYDWLGDGVYFWEANPLRALEFASEQQNRRPRQDQEPSVVGAIIDLGLCLDLTTSTGIQLTAIAHKQLSAMAATEGRELPINRPNGQRFLDRNVINLAHDIWAKRHGSGFDTVKGVFTEGAPAYAGAGFQTKTHIQIAVRNLECIKGVFRVPNNHLSQL